MPHKELLDYISNARQKNFEDNHIRQKLYSAGWELDDVWEAFLHLEGRPTKRLSGMALGSLVLSFVLPPVGLALAIYSMSKSKNYRYGKEFATASLFVGFVGTFALGYFFLNDGTITGFAAKDENGLYTYRVTLRNDNDAKISITGAELVNCPKPDFLGAEPLIIEPGEPFDVRVSCDERGHDQLELRFIYHDTGELSSYIAEI